MLVLVRSAKRLRSNHDTKSVENAYQVPWSFVAVAQVPVVIADQVGWRLQGPREYQELFFHHSSFD